MGFDPARRAFVLMDLAEQVHARGGGEARRGREAGAAARGIDVRLGLTLTEVHAEHVVLSDDSLIRIHTVHG